MILVVGGTGFVGRHLVQRLFSAGERVRVLARKPRPTIPPQVEFVLGDITKPETLPRAMVGVTAIYHLATIPKEKGRETFAAVNVEGTRNVIAAAKAAGIKRFIYMSIIGADPDPHLPYPNSKWRAEDEVKKSRLDWSILKASIIFGEGDEFVRKAARTVKNILEASLLSLDAPPSVWSKLLVWGRLIPIIPIPGRGQAKFHPIWIQDAVSCLLQVLKQKRFIGQTVAIGGPEYISYEGLVDLAHGVFPGPRLKLHIPIALMATIAGAMRALGVYFPATPEQVALLARDDITELDSVQRNFGFTPASLREKIDYLRSEI